MNMIVIRCTMHERLFSSSHTNWCSKLWRVGDGCWWLVLVGVSAGDAVTSSCIGRDNGSYLWPMKKLLGMFAYFVST